MTIAPEQPQWTPEEQAAQQAAAVKSHVRQKIEAEAGDVPSLLGTTADAAQMLLFGMASLVAKLSIATSLKEVREAAEPFAEMSADFLTKIEAGTVRLPFQTKGTAIVIADIESRATAVSDVIAQITPAPTEPEAE